MGYVMFKSNTKRGLADLAPTSEKCAKLLAMVAGLRPCNEAQDERYAEILVDVAGLCPFYAVEKLFKDYPPSPQVIYLLMVKAQKALQDEKKKRFVPVRKKGTEKKIEAARNLYADIKIMNADLLAKPASEGWGSKKKRAEHISKRTGKSFSYISRIIAKPRNTNQT